MRRKWKLLCCAALLLAVACGKGDRHGGSLAEGELTPIGEHERSQLVITTEDEFSVLFAVTTDGADLEDAEAERLTDFWYVKITLPRSYEPEIRSQTGFTVDLTSAEPFVEFVQVYRGLCNPQEPDLDKRYTCWLLERYESGQAGLSGQLTVRVYDGDIDTRYDITWEGLTDRFDGPPQQHRRRILHGGLAVEE